MKKRVLVTGGAGFLGSYLCEELLNKGNEVFCLDNFFTGHKKNIIHLLDNPYFELIRHDVTMPFYIEADEIYNLACPASPVYYQLNPIKTIKTSVMGSVNMLGLAKRIKAKILQASTSEVYGNPEEHPQNENYHGKVNPIGDRACYDEGKRCAESLFINYYRQNNVKIKILRIFNTYGPRMSANDGRVISNFIVSALKNKNIEVFGDGSQTRSFCYVDDMIKGMIRFMDTPDNITGPLNIGNSQEYSIIEIAEKIIEITGSRSKIIFKSLPEDDPLKRSPDISEARKTIDWNPEIDLDEGLKQTVKYFESII